MVLRGSFLRIFERMAREVKARRYICECSDSDRFDSTATVVRNSVLIISILPFRIVACTFFPTTFLEIAVFSAGHLSWSRGSPLSWDIKSVPVYSVKAQEKLVLAMNRLLEFSASLVLFCLETSLFESLATWIQGKCKRQLSLQIQLPLIAPCCWDVSS